MRTRCSIRTKSDSSNRKRQGISPIPLRPAATAVLGSPEPSSSGMYGHCFDPSLTLSFRCSTKWFARSTLAFYMLCLLSFAFPLISAYSPEQVFFPAAIPLSIRSPYMSVWQQSMNGGTPLSSSWPMFWGLQVCVLVCPSELHVLRSDYRHTVNHGLGGKDQGGRSNIFLVRR